MKACCAILAMSLLLAGCASVPPPVTLSPQSPVHPQAPEAATPPAAPTLTGESDDASQGSPVPEMEAPGDHQMPMPVPSEYTCPMHPQVRAPKPGVCSICGMALVEKPPPRPPGNDAP